MLFNVKRYIV